MPARILNAMTLGRRWWTLCTVALLLVHTVVSFTGTRGYVLTTFGDILQLLLFSAAAPVMASNAVSTKGRTRVFWSLMAVGCGMWALDLAGWGWYEVVLRRPIPDPFACDIILFLHVVPMMAAVALRPHVSPQDRKPYFSTLNFLMLLVWWVFLYSYIVFPDEYVLVNAGVYSRNYDLLYLIENLALMAALGALAASTRGPWKKIYWNFFLASGVYTLSSGYLNAAIRAGQYYTGSIYDVPFIASICWLISAGLLARELRPGCEPNVVREHRWFSMAPRLAMLAILSLPVLGYWAWFGGTSPANLRYFRILVTLAAMLVLGLFVFAHQYLLDGELMRLLEQSRRELENLQRLQTQLIQREKLASLGQLVAGAAHEINIPLTEIFAYAEQLAGRAGMQPDQTAMAEKIGHQAKRTRELVSGLLNFSQQSPGEKSLVDVGALVKRAVQMEMIRMESKNIRVHTSIAPDLPLIFGNANQLFQCCLEIIGNAMDALEAVGSGTFTVRARVANGEIILEFSDSGPGIADPKRVFDPFYTTKPIGKGTGLGLSATYGVMQDHDGEITCYNQAQGGATFVVRLPAASASSVGA